MSKDAAATQSATDSRFAQLRFAQGVLRSEADAIGRLAAKLPESFCDVVDKILACPGALVVCGMGKAGLVGRKLSASFCSTGTPSHFLHPAEAIHGDLGAVRAKDVILMLSSSGETEEVVRIVSPLRAEGATVVAMTNRDQSTLARRADLVLGLGAVDEACHLGLAPSTSTAVMLALGDALALTVSRLRGFAREDFARFHPGGSLGRRLAKVDDVMRPLDQCRVASETLTVRQVLTRQPQPGRRSGVILLTNSQGALTGVFTDSDLARMLSGERWDSLDREIRDEMTSTPKTIPCGESLELAVALLDRYKISELPVIDGDGVPKGILDITDVVGMAGAANSPQPTKAEDSEQPPITISFPSKGGSTT